MYGLPVGFDASRFEGLTLEQVSFSANTIHLSFSNAVSITILASFEHRVRDAVVSGQASVPVQQSQLMQLIGGSVASARGAVDGTLTLRFSNGQRLTCYDDTPMYEAYTMTFGDEEIFV
jgi:hypothetical protein